jgi:antitoxin VapB
MIHPEKDESAMPISIKDPDTDSKIRDLAALTGESITVAVRVAIEQRLRRESARRRAGVAERLLALSLAKSGPKRHDESAEDAIGYDEHGLPR